MVTSQALYQVMYGNMTSDTHVCDKCILMQQLWPHLWVTEGIFSLLRQVWHGCFLICRQTVYCMMKLRNLSKFEWILTMGIFRYSFPFSPRGLRILASNEPKMSTFWMFCFIILLVHHLLSII